LGGKSRNKGGVFSRNNESEASTVVQVVTILESKGLIQEGIAKTLDSKFTYNTTRITDKHPSYIKILMLNKTTKHNSFLASEHVSEENKHTHIYDMLMIFVHGCENPRLLSEG
jgi:hypothetical protein